MANSTLLALIQNTLQGMGVAGFGQPTTVVGNTNQDIVQVLALVNAEADALAHERDWQAQQVQHIFYTNYYTYTGTLSTTAGNSLYLPGTLGSYASTPDSTALDITGDIQVIGYCAPDTIVSGAVNYLFNKFTAAGDQRSFRGSINATGRLNLQISLDGSTTNTLSSPSTVVLPYSNGQGFWWKMERVSATGVTTYSTSTDPATTSHTSVSWTQLGATVANTVGAIYSSTSPYYIGQKIDTAEGPFDGKIYSVYVYNGIGGTLVASFNADDGAPGTNTVVSSSTGETYTIQGNAQIIANANTITGLSSIAGLIENPTYFQVTGVGVNQDTFLLSVAGDTATMNQPATASGTGVSLTFSQLLYPMPTGFDRQIDRTHWDKSKHWEMLGPNTPQQREWLRSGYISTGPRIRYSYMGGYFAIWPPLGTNESLSYEYVSKYWVIATNPTTLTPTKQAFTVDTDTCIFPDALMRALIKLKYFEIKGFDTTAYYRDYVQQRDLAKANDSGSQTLAMNPRPASILIGWENIPDSNFGQ